MSELRFMITGDALIISMDRTYVQIQKNDKRFQTLKDLVRKNDVDGVRNILTPKTKAKKKILSGKKFMQDSTLLLQDDGSLMDSFGEKLPELLSSRIVQMRDEGFSIKPLETFWNRLATNPGKNTKNQLWRFLQHQGHALTEDGCFVGYRGVTEDLKDVTTRTFDNSPGSICEMPRNQVDDEPNRTCSHGLHVGSWNYASTFGPVVVEVKVAPEDVVAVPNDYNGQKMRVCRFEVLNICKAPIKEAVYAGAEEIMWLPYVEDPVVEEGHSEEVVSRVESMAKKFAPKYADLTYLAVRIGEEVEDIFVADILDILANVLPERQAATQVSKAGPARLPNGRFAPKVQPTQTAVIKSGPTRDSSGRFAKRGA